MSVLDIRQHEMETHELLRQRNEEVIDSVFPTDYGFTICIDPYEFENIVSDKSKIKIKYNFDCYCWSKTNKRSKTFIVKNQDGRSVTNKDCIQRLIDAGFDTKCNHHFLEGFDKCSDDCFEISMGS